MLALAWRKGGFLKEESKGRFLVNAWLRIMSGHGANPIFFNKENKDWTSITLTNPPRPTYPPPPPPHPHPLTLLKVDVICVSSLSVLHCFCKTLKLIIHNLLYKYLTTEKIYTLNSLVFKDAIQQSTQL